jgi:hypothetical protein
MVWERHAKVNNNQKKRDGVLSHLWTSLLGKSEHSSKRPLVHNLPHISLIHFFFPARCHPPVSLNNQAGRF